MILEILAGILFAILVILFGNAQNLSCRFYYGISLIILPVIYMTFGIFADGTGVIGQELLYGLPFIVMGIVCAITDFKYAGYIVAVFWFSHAAYDMIHPQLFTNSGVPSWYPVVCAAIDFSIGLWISYLMLTGSDAEENPVV